MATSTKAYVASAASTNISTHEDWFRHVAVIDGAARTSQSSAVLVCAPQPWLLPDFKGHPCTNNLHAWGLTLGILGVAHSLQPFML